MVRPALRRNVLLLSNRFNGGDSRRLRLVPSLTNRGHEDIIYRISRNLLAELPNGRRFRRTQFENVWGVAAVNVASVAKFISGFPNAYTRRTDQSQTVKSNVAVKKAIKDAPAKPVLDDDMVGQIEDAFTELENVEAYELSEAEVASDNLSSALITAFFHGRKNPFIGREPTLYEVVDRLHEKYGLSDAAVEAAHEIRSLIEDAYAADEDDVIYEDIKDWTNILIAELRKFIDGFENASVGSPS